MRSLSRDELIDAVQHGRMSPAVAEAEAAKLGFRPFASTPDPKTFDPMGEVGWTLPMTVAWIVWRDREKVLQFFDPYRAECFDWHFRKWRVGFDGPIYEGHFLNERSPATLSLVSLTQHIESASEAAGDTTQNARDAMSMLWKALQEGRLEASGLSSPDRPRLSIPAHEWHELEAVEENGTDTLRNQNSLTVYRKIVLSRRSILALWHAKRPAALTYELPPTTSPKGPGDFPLYCAAQWIATQGGRKTFDPSTESIWCSTFEELRANIASENVTVTGVRNGRSEKIDPHIFSAALRIGHPFGLEPLDLILSDDLYLSPCPFVDAEHWQNGFNDSLQSRRGIEWSKLTVLKSDIARCWPFAGDWQDHVQPVSFRTGAPGRPTPIHLVVAEHQRRLERREAKAGVAAEADHLAHWLATAHPDVPKLTSKTIQNRIRANHRAAKNAPK